MPGQPQRPKNGGPIKKTRAMEQTPRVYDSESMALMSLRLIAAPNPEDDLSDEEIYDICRKSPFSSEIIKQLIEYIKTILG